MFGNAYSKCFLLLLLKVSFSGGIILLPYPVLAVSPTTGSATPIDFAVLPVGLIVGDRLKVSSSLIWGAEDGEQAVRFTEWLIPFEDIITIFKIRTTRLANGKLELNSPGFILQIEPNQLVMNNNIGKAMRIADIERLFQVTAQFDILQYAIKFAIPWNPYVSNFNSNTSELPVILDGLPTVEPNGFSLSSIGEHITVRGDKGNIVSTGDLTTVGQIDNSSWYSRIHQTNLTNPDTWRLDELQYLNENPNTDIALGSQSTFWQSTNSGDYWGGTLVYRNNFQANQYSTNGFNPNVRTQTENVPRTITGEAAPGSLVRLIEGNNTIVKEVLVDSSGIYRFDNVISRNSYFSDYQIFIYPNGLLTATPTIVRPQFIARTGQLPQHASAWIISAGTRRATDNNTFWGTAHTNVAAIAYRYGMTETLTLGGGFVQDDNPYMLTEANYQPHWIPLSFNFAALRNLTNQKITYNADALLKLANNASIQFFGDTQARRISAHWNPVSSLGLYIEGDDRTELIIAGLNTAYYDYPFIGIFNAKYNTDNKLQYSTDFYWRAWKLKLNDDQIRRDITLRYNLSSNTNPDYGHAIELINNKYELNNVQQELTQLGWNYRSTERGPYGRDKWNVNCSYATGTHGDGINLSLNTTIIPGMLLTFRYEGVSLTSSGSSFVLELSSSVRVQPKLDIGSDRINELRGMGGILIVPFLDKNGDGQLNTQEPIYTHNPALLILIDNKKVSALNLQATEGGIYVQLPHGKHRLDLDPAGYPTGASAASNAYAITVMPGGYTSVTIPLNITYTIGGIATDRKGNPLKSVQIQAIPEHGEETVYAMVRNKGVFFLDGLKLGRYRILINNKPATPEWIEITSESEQMVEINLKSN